jgi:hypothetical protein
LSNPIRPASEGCDLQEAARHGEVLQEVDQLVLIREVRVKGKRGNHAEACENERDKAGAKSGDQRKAAAPPRSARRRSAQRARRAGPALAI